jgi:uncharacterized protein involved in exopolysaccharide biosynthesis
VVRIVHTQWRVIALSIVLTTALAAILAVMLPRRYRATAIAAVTPLSGSLTPSEAFHGVEALDRRSLVATVAALPSTSLVTGSGYDISAVVLPNTNLVRIDVDARSAEMAASVANAALTEIGTQTRTMFKYYDVAPVKKAVPPTTAALPHRARIIAAGWVLGILLGAVLAYVRSRTIVPV